MQVKLLTIFIFVIFLLPIIFFFPPVINSQERELNKNITNIDDSSGSKNNDTDEYTENGNTETGSELEEIGFYDLEEYLSVEVEVASLFIEDELVIGSTVSGIVPAQWKIRGARRMTDALENETAIMTYPSVRGYNVTAIRGYTRDSMTTRGVVYMIDGVPIISLNNSTSESFTNIGLGALNRIEIIKGPGSAIYGSDAFHGVISLKTFESEKEHFSVETAGAYPLYIDGNIKLSHKFFDSLRIDTAVSYNHQIASQELKYEYDTKELMRDDHLVLGLLGYDQQSASGKAVYENRHRTLTGVLKLDLKPLDKLEVNLNGYVINNKNEKFSGLKEVTYIQLNEHDHSSQLSTISMGLGSIAYLFPNDISLEAKGYFWYMKTTEDMIVRPDEKYAMHWIDEKRGGAELILKQPDNPLNLQWLLAYSISNSEVVNLETETREKDGTPWSPVAGSLEPKSKLGSHGMKRTINSLYAQTKWGFLNNLFFLLLGGRLDHYSDWGSQLTPRGGIIFLPAEKISVKALYGRAFRAPSGNTIHGVYGYTLANPDIEPETIDVYELIFMYKKKNWKVVLCGYYTDWQNGIVLLSSMEAMSQGSFGEPLNVGENRSYGGEINFTLFKKPIAAEFGFSYVRSEAIDLELRTDPSNPVNPNTEKKDVKYDAFPEYMIICSIHYNFKPLDINFDLNNRVLLNMKESADPNEPDHLPAYWRVDLNISKSITDELQLYLDIKNINNRNNYKPTLHYSLLSDESGFVEPEISVLLRAEYQI